MPRSHNEHVENVTDRLRNSFGVAYPCEGGSPVASYGDADVHLVGDHPDVHGGRESGVPFDAPAVAPARRRAANGRTGRGRRPGLDTRR